MVKLLIDNVKNINSKILNVIYKTLEFSIILFIISIYILYLYNIYPLSYDLLASSILIFKVGLCTAISGFLYGFFIHKIKE